jgi:hypothetical protein
MDADELDWNRTLREQWEFHWNHRLHARLDGLTDDEYLTNLTTRVEQVPGVRFGTLLAALRTVPDVRAAMFTEVIDAARRIAAENPTDPCQDQ